MTKKPAAHVLKRPATVLRKPASNLKNSGKWLWLGIVVGRGKEVYTHENGKKRVTFRLLPKASEAADHKPRGLHEIESTLQMHVAKGSILVHDGWTATEAAVCSLGYQSPPGVKHDTGYRDVATGFHTNDAESENSRLKRWNRSRYGTLTLSEPELFEYVYYINIGSSWEDVMKGLSLG